jgi:superfamily II DNA/RNA helicase
LDTHVHRVGRAGRLSKEKSSPLVGTAYTLLTTENKNDADFAVVLRNSFEREGREITPELDSLAQKSRRNGNVESRTKWNKLGLGFRNADPTISLPNTGNETNGARDAYRQPDPLLPSKRSRWDS